MSNGFAFLRLPLEIRQLVYWELLALDHNSLNWAWDLESIGAFNRRHGIIRVNAQIRQETQRFFYENIPWQIQIYCFPPEHWIPSESCTIFRILETLYGREQLVYFRELTLLLVIPNWHFIDRPSALSRVSSYINTICGYFPRVQRLNISWCDHNWRIDWNEKTTTLLEPLVNMQSISSIIIQEGRYHDGRKTTTAFMACIDRMMDKRRREAGVKMVEILKRSQ